MTGPAQVTYEDVEEASKRFAEWMSVGSAEARRRGGGSEEEMAEWMGSTFVAAMEGLGFENPDSARLTILLAKLIHQFFEYENFDDETAGAVVLATAFVFAERDRRTL